ncbi:uncharacterized protein TNCV_2943141 [Trichonephila clavipes]|nr:uncharacterized protein TNCV_2943141 [Trichonephila clavipes]
MTPHTITLLHTRTRLLSLLRLNLVSSLKTTYSAAVQFHRAWQHSKRRRRWVGVKGSTHNGVQPGAFLWFYKSQGPLVMVLHVPGWWPQKPLAVRVHFLRFGGLLDEWSVEGVLGLVFVYITSLGYTSPNTSSQHNKSGLIDELLIKLISQLPSC